MRINLEKPKISDYDFLRLFSATMISDNHGAFIEKRKIEEELVNFYNNPNFYFLFEDIIKKKATNKEALDLNRAFQAAYAFELLIMIQDNQPNIRSIINLTRSEAEEVISGYDTKYTLAVSDLLTKMKEVKEIEQKILQKK